MTDPAEGTPSRTRDQYTRDEYWRDLAQQAWDRGRAAADAADLPAARRWLERARRLQPRDDTVAFSLAMVLLRSGAAEEAAPLFAGVAERHGMADAWAGLAACRRLLGQAGRAAEALQAALSRSAPTGAMRGLAGLVAADAGLPGWCGVDGQGVLHTGPVRPDNVLLDGAPVQPGPEGALPVRWRRARFLSATRGDSPLLGSPVDLASIRAVEGFVELRDGDLHGWAWHPADSTLDPIVVLGDGQPILLHEASPVRLTRPLARPRALHLPRAQLGPVVEVRGSDGRHLLGSPIHLRPSRTRRVRAEARRPEYADVVIPVYGGLEHTLACLDAVLATVPSGTRVHVVDDASPDPALAAALDSLARDGRIRLIRLAENRGFPAAANAGLRACGRRDAVLLNSDTLVPPGWLERLRAAACAAPDIGTATPLSNDATILSYPDPAGGNPAPDAAGVETLDRLAQRANGGTVADIPTAVGFCMYVRRDCLDRVGPLREDAFAQGYGEENDFCRRAAGLGFRHVAALGVFVGHLGGQSFGAARTHLLARNLAVLNRLHPGYDALVAEHIRADPLAPARRRMDALRWAERTAAGSAVLITHAGGGGVDRVVAARCAVLRAEGLRPVVLRPQDRRCLVQDGMGGDFPNLAYALPDEMDALLDLLRAGQPRYVELHHLLGHEPAILQVSGRLGLPLDTYVHDYALFCPRISLVGRSERYCGEPDVAGCVMCIGELGSHLEEAIGVPELVTRSAGLLESSRRVVAPSADAAARMRRHFPRFRPEVLPWEDDSVLPPLAPVPGGPVRRVCVPGAIGVEKGYNVLLALARDARARRLPISFVVVGYTNDDTALMDAGPVFVTGEYAEAEAVALIRAQRAHLALIPSVWPETWCYALSRAWQAGLPAAAFDLGAPAERIRRTGRGWVVPLGLSSSALNDMLLCLPFPSPPPRAEAHVSMTMNQLQVM